MGYGKIFINALVVIIFSVDLVVSWKARCVYFGNGVKPCKRDDSPANFFVAIGILAFSVLFLFAFGVVRPLLDIYSKKVAM